MGARAPAPLRPHAPRARDRARRPTRTPALLLALLTGLLLGLAAATGAQAADEPAGWAYRLANELMSPFCPGRTLADCPSGYAGDLRMWIVVQEAAGRTREDVEGELYERYGDVIRPAPRPEGLGLAAYVAPVAVFLLGGAALAWFLRRFRRAPAGAREDAPPPADSDPELARIVDEELAR